MILLHRASRSLRAEATGAIASTAAVDGQRHAFAVAFGTDSDQRARSVSEPGRPAQRR